MYISIHLYLSHKNFLYKIYYILSYPVYYFQILSNTVSLNHIQFHQICSSSIQAHQISSNSIFPPAISYLQIVFPQHFRKLLQSTIPDASIVNIESYKEAALQSGIATTTAASPIGYIVAVAILSVVSASSISKFNLGNFVFKIHIINGGFFLQFFLNWSLYNLAILLQQNEHFMWTIGTATTSWQWSTQCERRFPRSGG